MTVSKGTSQIDSLASELPDPRGALLFHERLSAERPAAARKLNSDPGLLSDVLSLAAWSPFLATTILQHPEYISWLGRERQVARVRTRDEISESLARFSLTNSQVDPHVMLARFRRRELLRIYLRDIRHTHTLVETTEELSNLADAILDYALSLACQEMDNRYGQPQMLDERGRIGVTTFCIVALGKLGSYELNYASDIDLMFLYCEDGTTSGTGTKGVTSNREYFVKLAEHVTRLVGQPVGEGAAYRVDLRLRPHGRSGALAVSLNEATRYYAEKAQPWELQALIRARSAAGDPSVYARFASAVRARVFKPNVSASEALGNVREAKRKIDDQHGGETHGYNVKLGEGGIRELEFISQALQLAKGGTDEWLRASHTLISLGRLADRGWITQTERAELFDAYDFLRKVEHRLQMENGLQTHLVPDDDAKRKLLASRMDFRGDEVLADFDATLSRHTGNVSRSFKRIFGREQTSPSHTVAGALPTSEPSSDADHDSPFASVVSTPETESRLIDTAALALASRLAPPKESAETDLAALIDRAARSSLNERRAVSLTARIASSLQKSQDEIGLTAADVEAAVRLSGSSEFFGEWLAANPSLVAGLGNTDNQIEPQGYRTLMLAAVEDHKGYGANLSAIRKQWSRLMLGIGVNDNENRLELRQGNGLQTELAAASIDAAIEIAYNEIQARYGAFDSPPRLAVLGLGRLGGGGMDYGSDLDVVLVYDDSAPSPFKGMAALDAYSKVCELMVGTLSSLTRDGYLYRVDLRLRPDGKNGTTCLGAGAFLEYLGTRAAIWEWLAYVKLRGVAGSTDLALDTERRARTVIHELASSVDPEQLKSETRRVRQRLEDDRGGRRPGVIDIKYGRGGMLDVYFATRFLQLRENVPDIDEDRSTSKTLERLLTAGSLDNRDYEPMRTGYKLLRRLDHEIRLTIGRSTRLPAADHPALLEIAQRMGYRTSEELLAAVRAKMSSIHDAFERVVA